MKLSKVVLLCTLSLGLSPIAKANMKWIKTINGFCPTVCQKNAEYKYNKENAIYKFAVPAGINPRATKARGTEQVYYVCATNIGFAGWRVGYNIEYQQYRCYTGFCKSEHYGESYYCLCTDKEMLPIGK